MGNRAGELLDRGELTSLCMFLSLVTIAQFVLLSEPGNHGDLIPVLLGCTLLSLSFALSHLAQGLFGLKLYFESVTTLVMSGFLILYWVMIDKKRVAMLVNYFLLIF